MPPKRQTWDEDAMKKAVEAVLNKTMGYLKASKTFSVPQTTLERYVKKKTTLKAKMGRKTILSDNLEAELLKYCTVMDQRFFGLTRKDIKLMAFRLAERNNLKGFSKELQSAGEKWLNLFLRRHPQLTTRVPQGLSKARAEGFNKENVSAFFDIFREAFTTVKGNPARIYNCDESGITCVQHKHSKVIAMKGKRSVAKLQSAERGALVTTIFAMSATGHFIPPMLIFPRKRMKAELTDGAPPGAIFGCQKSGWIDKELFLSWFHHFVQVTKPSKEDPVLLVLDGHFSHTRNPDLIEAARKNSVHVVCLPPHSTHKLQPLDVAFMKPFKTFYSQAIENWMMNHPFRAVTAFQISSLLGTAYLRASNAEYAVSGFRKTGLYPFNDSIFRDEDFIPVQEEPPREEEDIEVKTPVTPQDIQPIPQMPSSSGTTGRRGAAALITGTPYKEKLEESLQRTESRVTKKKAAKKLGFEEADLPTSSGAEQKLFDEVDNLPSSSGGEWNESESEDDVDEDAFFDFVPGSLKTKDFVLVEFAGKKKKLFYVGQVIDVLNDESVNVKFMKKMKRQYVWPNVNDEAEVPLKDIRKLLPNPKERRGYFNFLVNFPPSLTLV